MPTEAQRTVLVAGATGRLGRPLTRLLLQRGHAVRALARDTGSEAAREIATLGAQLVAGDFDDPAGLVSAIDGADVVFASGTAHRAGPQGEARHGTNLADAVEAANGPYLVYVSGAGADRATGVPVFESKRAVEHRIRALGLRGTVLAPVYLMENAFNAWNLPSLARGRFPLPLPGDRVLQQVAIADVVAFAAMVIDPGEALDGRRIELASDQLTGIEAAQALSRATGRSFAFERMPVEQLAPPLRKLFEWLETVGHSVDIAGLHRRHPDVGWHRFETWAAQQRWRRFAPPSRP
jgi:uncharacterized protein YbjT (DUF2867 family)